MQQLDAAQNISNSNRARADKTPYEQKPQMQRKCWICSSPSHLQSACPRKVSSGMKTGGSDVRSARVNACSIDIGDDRQRVNTACDITRDADDDETTLMKVHVNRCVLEVPSATDDAGRCAYAFECPTTLRVGESEVTLKHTPASSASCDSDVISGETKPDRVLMTRPSTLTYVSLLRVRGHINVWSILAVKCP